MTNAPGYQFTIGNVLGTSFAVLVRNIVAFGVLALGFRLLIVVAKWLTEVIGPQLGTAANASAPVDLSARALSGLLGTALYLVSIVIAGLVTAAVSFGVFQDLRGQRAGIGECLSRGLTPILPVVIASVLFTLLVGIGGVLLVVPGVLMWLAFWLYMPTIVVEKRGIREGFRRSSFLTRGRRWTAVGLWLIVGIPSFIVSFELIRISRSATGEWVSVVIYVWKAATMAFSAVMTAVSYYYLRIDKEGVAIDEIAAVFD